MRSSPEGWSWDFLTSGSRFSRQSGKICKPELQNRSKEEEASSEKQEAGMGG